MRDPKLKLNNRLREFRKKSGLTQTELAQKVGTSKNTISSIETGQFCPTAYLAALLCLALDCRFEELFMLELVEAKDNVHHKELIPDSGEEQ